MLGDAWKQNIYDVNNDTRNMTHCSISVRLEIETFKYETWNLCF